MVNVGDKPVSHRVCIARGEVQKKKGKRGNDKDNHGGIGDPLCEKTGHYLTPTLSRGSIRSDGICHSHTLAPQLSGRTVTS